jgi:dolichyl-phosphate-mannose--protein O-mannosyl transferase
LPSLGSLGIVPIATYLFCYTGWFVGENGWNRHWADSHGTIGHAHVLGMSIPLWWGWVPGPIRSLGSYTYEAYTFHTGLDSPHAYGSGPWSWLVLGRPVDFYYHASKNNCGASACSREVLLIGTPLLWWAFVPMLLWLAWHYISTRDWRAAAIWVAFLAGWVFWLRYPDRTKFLFYMAPLMPFLIFGLTLALGVLLGPGLRTSADARTAKRRRWGLAGVSVFLGLVVIDFAWMWSILTGTVTSYDVWHAHMWLPSWV